jgi:hypothetical protein
MIEVRANPAAVTTLLNIIGAVSGIVTIGDFGFKAGKFKDDNFNMIDYDDCETLYVCPGDHTEVCSKAPLRLRYKSSQGHLFDVRAYERFGEARTTWTECAMVWPRQNGQIATCHYVKFCSGEPESGLSVVANNNKNTKEIWVGPTYFKYLKECYLKSCTPERFKELGRRMAKALQEKKRKD